jgi:hypothetical protein
VGLLQFLGQLLRLEVSLVVSLFDKLNGLTISPLITPVDPYDPPFTSKCLSKVVEFEVLVAWVDVTDVVVSLWFAVSCIDFPGAVVAEFIHKAVLHGGQDEVIHSVAVLGDIVLFVYVGVHSTSNTHHPQELVDIVTRVTTYSSVNDQNIVYIESITHFECLVLRGAHSKTDGSDVGIVPSIVINKSSPIRETSNLIAIVPPTHDD